MTLTEVLTEAEKDAEGIIERVRQQIVLRVMATTRFDGPIGQSLRSGVDSIIQSQLGNASFQFHQDLTDAWNAGIARAEKGMDQTHSILTPDTMMFQESIKRSFSSLATSMSEKINSILLRASLNDDWTRDKVVDLIGTDPSAGVFAEFRSRADGIVDYGAQTSESTAFSRRLREIQRVLAQQSAMNLARRDVKEKKVVLIMKVWNHAGSGNPPRPNHVAFNGKAVPVDMKFLLPGRDGTQHSCEGPHDITLPIGEVANCHCTEVTVPLHITVEEEKEIRAQAESTGGFRDDRWET